MRHYILGALRISTLVLAVTVIAAGAQEMKPPQVSGVYADWQLAVELAALDALNARREETSGGEPSERPLDELNAATGTRFPNIAASPAPLTPTPPTVALASPYEPADFYHCCRGQWR